MKYFLIITFMLITLSGCSDRFETPVKSKDGTEIYLPKNDKGITASITFGNKWNKKNKKITGKDTLFSTGKKAKVYALISLKNQGLNNCKDQIFHADWIAPGEKLLYRKQITIPKDKITSAFTSSISIPPGRIPGKYSLRIYLYRELIAEKYFRLQTGSVVEKSNFKEIRIRRISASMLLCKKLSTKNKKLLGTGTNFFIGKKNKVLAVANFRHLLPGKDKNLKLFFDWKDSDNKSFYRKKIIFTTSDTIAAIQSSISISPGKRQPGDYSVAIYLSKKKLTERKFTLSNKIIKSK